MRRVHLICVALAIITLLVYWRAYSADFVNYDDNHYVTENPRVLAGASRESFAWALRATSLGNWHPLAWMSHIVDVQLFGLNPAGHHASSVAIHTIAAILLFLVLRRMTGAEWRSALVAALFAWHPLHVESVAWISERKDTLSAVFCALTIWAYVRFTERKTAERYLLALLAFLGALMSKPTMVTLPALLFLLDLWPLGRLRRETVLRCIVEKIPFFLLAVGVSIITIYAQDELGAVKDLHRYAFKMRLANAVIAYTTYLVKTFAPTSLAAFYPHPASLPGAVISPLRLGLSASALLMLTLLAWSQRRSRPYITVGWFWYLIALVPMIGLVQVGVQSHADRYTYISLIGIFIAVVWSWPRQLHHLGITVAIVVLSACLLLTFNQTRYWQDSITLFKHAVDVVPNNYLAHNNLGTALAARGEIPEAASHFRAAIAIQPNYVDAHANLGSALIDLHQITDAEKHLQITLHLKSDHAEAHNNLANILAERGNVEAAEQHYLAAIKANPDVPQSHHSYASLLASQNRPAEAIAQWRTALRLRPDYANAQLALAQELLRTKHGAEAIERFTLSDPTHSKPADVFGWLGWVLATDPDANVRDAAQALRVAERACELTRRSNPAALDAFAAALAAAGRFADATETALRAAQMAERLGQNDFAKEISERAKLYNARKPFIMMPTSQRAVP